MSSYEPVWLDLDDPNPRAQIRRVVIRQYSNEPGYVYLAACHANGAATRGRTLRVPVGDLDKLADAIRKYGLGPLGRMAIDADTD